MSINKMQKNPSQRKVLRSSIERDAFYCFSSDCSLKFEKFLIFFCFHRAVQISEKPVTAENLLLNILK